MKEMLAENDGVQLEEGMHHDLQSMMNEMTSEVWSAFRRFILKDNLGSTAWSNADERSLTDMLAFSAHKMVPPPQVQVNRCLPCNEEYWLSYSTIQENIVYSNWNKGNLGFSATVNKQLIEDSLGYYY